MVREVAPLGDIVKFFGLLAVSYNIERRAWFKTLAALIIWMAAVLYSVAAATGFIATMRAENTNYYLEQVKTFDKAETRLKYLEQDLSEAKKSDRWGTSNACTNATVTESREFCTNVKSIQAKIENETKIIRNGKPKENDPQATAISNVTGYEVAEVQLGLAIFVGIIGELLSTLGMYAFSATRRTWDDEKKKGGRKTAGESRVKLVAVK